MRRPSTKQRRLVILLLVLITFSVAYYAGYTHKQQARQLPQIEGILINPPQPLPPIDLYNQIGEPFSLTDLQGHWSLLMLDPAPGSSASSALTRLIQVHNHLATEPDLQQQIHFLYLSRAKMEEQAISFVSISDNVQALHGDTQMIDKAFKVFGGYANDMDYSLILIGPNTKMHALFTRSSNAATIAEDLNNLITAMQ
jgi:cytochrome oxidase Cu insertion factor (SCO1/SenC/PrrC family)